MNAWCFDKKVKPCSMLMQNISLYHSVFLLMGGKESIFFCFKTKNVSKQQSWTQNQRQATLSKLISLFWKQWEGEESLFLKEKQEAHYMQMHSVFNFLKT